MPRKKKVVTEAVQAVPELPIVEEAKAPKFKAEDVVVCPKCGTKMIGKTEKDEDEWFEEEEELDMILDDD